MNHLAEAISSGAESTEHIPHSSNSPLAGVMGVTPTLEATPIEIESAEARVLVTSLKDKWKCTVQFRDGQQFDITTNPFFYRVPRDLKKFVNDMCCLDERSTEEKKAIMGEIAEGMAKEFAFDYSEEVMKYPLLERSRIRLLYPAQDVDDDGRLIFGFTVQDEEGWHPLLIRSDREYIGLETLHRHGYSLKPVLSSDPRWEPDRIKAFLEENPATEFDAKHAYRIIRDLYEHFLDMPEESYYDILTLWVLGTYIHCRFPSYPYVHITGMHGTAKTKVLDLTALLCFNALCSSDCSAAVIYRIIEQGRCTMLLDESEALKGEKRNMSEKDRAILQILLSGYKSSGRVHRININSPELNVEEFLSYSAKMMASITEIDHVLESRCIKMVMRPPKKGDPRSEHNPLHDRADTWDEPRDLCYRFAMYSMGFDLDKVWETIRKERAADLEHVQRRNAELMRPLLTIAWIIGEEVFERAVAYAQALVVEKRFTDQDSIEAIAIEALVTVYNDKLGKEKVILYRDIAERMNHLAKHRWNFENANYGTRTAGEILRRLGLKRRRGTGGPAGAEVNDTVIEVLRSRFQSVFGDIESLNETSKSEHSEPMNNNKSPIDNKEMDNNNKHTTTHNSKGDCPSVIRETIRKLSDSCTPPTSPSSYLHSVHSGNPLLAIIPERGPKVDGIKTEDFFRKARDMGHSIASAEQALNRMMGDGDIFVPVRGRLVRLCGI